ncbi:ABC transporter permease [Terriglobus sp. TAA 43]|uniref:ABC transporter permease n=1 Tax=Terriglobus sp. TAA 43 TaxID=278961 RepID=UPI00068FDFD8|nr:ABC transporter permease [Terriglobus sp. TAA 43]
MRWQRFFRRKQADLELQQEIELYLEEEIDANIARGMDKDEARRRAHLKFGSVNRVREEVWRESSFLWIEHMWGDLRYVLRKLISAPSAALTVMISLGIGIAANALVFSGVDKIALQGPPVGDPTKLMSVYPTDQHGQRAQLIYAEVYESLRGQLKSFSDLAAFTSHIQVALTGRGEPRRAWGQSVTQNYFDVTQVPMTLGRGFGSRDVYSPVIVLGYDLWRIYFNADDRVIGNTVFLSGKPFTVIGVAKPKFRGTLQMQVADFWIPLSQQASLGFLQETDSELVNVIARFAPGVDRATAQAELNSVSQRLATAFPKEMQERELRCEQAGSLPAEAWVHIAAFVAAVMGIALLVLAIAVSNVTNLLLSRAMARHREMAIRIALGGTRWQLIQPMLLESLVLSLGGGVVGVGASVLAMRALTYFHMPVDLPIDLTLNISTVVLWYAFVLSVVAGMLCGLGPALAATRPSVPNALKGESSLEKPGRRWAMRDVLVMVQIAATMVLLCTTSLYLHSLLKLTNGNTGLRMDGVRVLSIDPVHNGYKAEQVPLVLKRVLDGVMAMPQVASAAWTDSTPLSIAMKSKKFHHVGQPGDLGLDPEADVYDVGPGYFATMGIQQIEGRNFNGAGPDGPKQMIVNEAFAHRMFKDRRAVGQYLTPTVPKDASPQTPVSYEIIGVVKNSKSTMMNFEDNPPIVYEALEQNMGTSAPLLGYSLMVHYQGNGAQVANALQAEVHSVDPSLAIFHQKEMAEQIMDSLIIPRAESTIFGVFGIAGLLLATVGLYGVMSYTVERRTKEMGIRLALGATMGQIQSLIVRYGIARTVIALAIGFPMALAASKVAASLQNGITAYDAISFTLTPLFLMLVALVACWIPARRASATDPQATLRHE